MLLSTPGTYILNKPLSRVAELIETLLYSRTQWQADDDCTVERHGEAERLGKLLYKGNEEMGSV